MEAQIQPVADRVDGYDCYVHGGAGHLYCERRPAAHRRLSRRLARRGDLGTDELSRFVGGDSANLRLALRPLRPQAFLHGLRDDVHRMLAFVRAGTDASCTHPGAYLAGPWWR